MDILAEVLEAARKDLLESHKTTITKSSSTYLARWVEHSETDPIMVSIKKAMAERNLEAPEVEREMYSSLKYRLIAGRLTLPVAYPEPSKGMCDKMEYDAQKNEFKCNVPGNQDQADNYHKAFGHGPLCPFNEANTEAEVTRSPDELEKLLADGEELEDAARLLGFDK